MRKKAKAFIAIFYRFSCWRRAISLIVLITFSSSAISPAFASYESIENKVDKDNQSSKFENRDGVKSSKSRTKPRNYRLKSSVGFEKDESLEYFSPRFSKLKSNNFLFGNRYQPYLKLGGAKYFNQNSNVAGIYDLFIPLLQTDDKIFFTNLRIFDRSGSSFEGNAHLGFRKLFLDKNQMVGLYASFDRKKTDHRNWFGQITIGAEYWNGKWFIGGNFYKPIGKTERLIKVKRRINIDSASKAVLINKYHEKALPGFDAELGFSFTHNLTGYVGGYYFHEKDTVTTVGPKAQLTYEHNSSHGRILGILDGIGIEAGVQHDKPRGTTAYIGIKFKIGLTNFNKTSNIFGFERHMVELVRRDPDIIIGNRTTQESEYKYYQPGDNGFQGGGGGGDNEDNSSDNYKKKLDKKLEEFGLSKDSLDNLSKEEALKLIQKKYREYALKYHPDRNIHIKDSPLYEQYSNLFMRYNNIYEELNDIIIKHKSGFKTDSSARFSKSKDSSFYQFKEQEQHSKSFEIQLATANIHADSQPALNTPQKEIEVFKSEEIIEKVIVPIAYKGTDHLSNRFVNINPRTENNQLTSIENSETRVMLKSELQLVKNPIFVRNEKARDLIDDAICVNENLANVTKIGLTKRDQFYKNPGTQIQPKWLAIKLNECVSWVYTHPKSMLVSIVGTLLTGWLTTKYFLGSFYDRITKPKRSKRKQRKNPLFFWRGR